ncbi:MAG: tRNA pseudouridine(55) synthase TruB [Chloroflexi bacterium]|nr:tRNA pseudouridine(55) synthase TruB [Chloroflexota bacterium]
MTTGILNVNKPPGITSFAVVSLVRRLTGVRRVGHAGTLDPIAEGVLPICIGPATRVVEYIVSAPKTYHTAVRLGVGTNTYDCEGEVVARGDPGNISQDEVAAALQAFVGEIDQVPPMFSALKHKGQPLYRYARAGKDVPREARKVMVYRARLTAFELPIVELELEVGRGAYVRTLAHDLGERLGCHAHVERLTRLRSGPFLLQDAHSLDELTQAAERGVLHELLHPVDRVLESWHAALLGAQHARDASSGRLLVLPPLRPDLIDLPADTPCRAYSEAGEFLAILRYRGAGRWHPDKVFAPL